MKFIDEYRNADAVKKIAAKIKAIGTKPWNIMEVCGGQTHAILRFGIDKLLPADITLLHGPGCPVCVTPVEQIDEAITLASKRNIIFCSFGDMLRVPGSQKDLLSVKAEGGDVRVCYSPLDALKIAQGNPSKDVVFFAVGFETTAPANGMAVYQASQLNVSNFAILSAQVLIPPAIDFLLKSKENRIDAFLAPGHVCTVTGYETYEELSSLYHVPIVVTGFEPVDILQGLYLALDQLERNRAEVENAYARVVRREGNLEAKKLMAEVFEVVDRKWRGLGNIPQSGLALRESYKNFDAETKYGLLDIPAEESSECISGLVLQGLKKPVECSAFGIRCTPEKPLGATMVSSEGACAAYYRYKNEPR
jgi:hydrogenase expression/formation protein HypD